MFKIRIRKHENRWGWACVEFDGTCPPFFFRHDHAGGWGTWRDAFANACAHFKGYHAVNTRGV